MLRALAAQSSVSYLASFDTLPREATVPRGCRPTRCVRLAWSRSRWMPSTAGARDLSRRRCRARPFARSRSSPAGPQRCISSDDDVWERAVQEYRPSAGTVADGEVRTVGGIDDAAALVAETASADRTVTMRHAQWNRFTWVRVEGRRRCRTSSVPVHGGHMSGGAYSALSGMQSRLDELDRIASDLANVSTAGYKTERTTSFAAERDFATALQSAVDVAAGRDEDRPSSGHRSRTPAESSTSPSTGRASSRSRPTVASDTPAAATSRARSDGVLTTAARAAGPRRTEPAHQARAWRTRDRRQRHHLRRRRAGRKDSAVARSTKKISFARPVRGSSPSQGVKPQAVDRRAHPGSPSNRPTCR